VSEFCKYSFHRPALQNLLQVRPVPKSRGVRLAKNDFGSVFGSVFAKNCGFQFGFSFTKLTAVSVFGSVLDCVLFNVYDARNDVLPY